jgi:geranylgeranyl diphosphate synthase type II
METIKRIERALAGALAGTEASDAPPRLARAMSYAVFPGGARVRPRLCLAVAEACGARDTALADAAAAAIELLHCASLVHDDLPCFDDAELRRGRASVHRAFGEPLAVLAGDALIVLAFQTLAQAGVKDPAHLPSLCRIIAEAVGAPRGICAGQAWECEPRIDLAAYHRAKTGALFAAAAQAGAVVAGVSPVKLGGWRLLGERLGEAFQIADDISDAVAEPSQTGKSTGRDAALGRPSAVATFGVVGALRQLEEVARLAVAEIPECQGSSELRALILLESRRLLPEALSVDAA